ncbi:replication initiation and membrane attachment family protein [Alkalibacillus aidingensis]|uniref:replication initiation and membrane attachment family protein n=1 Tax=Alkalibacillus aidingensis TaxID=2747607 RepID=UPI0016604914|nr:DnaD domain protein [Alkalibacillus aidingensis]
MQERMKHLLPNDRMKIIQQNSFFQDVESVLTLLYQPLIGMKSIAVFQALWKESDNRSTQSSISHHQMMSLLNISLDEFYEARKKLEGIGLLKSYKEEATYTTFYYLLKRPVSARQFFEHPTLSVLLEHHVGREVYHQLQKRLAPKLSFPANVTEVTKTFDEVFTTVATPKPKTSPKQSKEEDSVVIETDLPIEWLYKMLTQQQVEPKKILTPSNLNYMEKMIKIFDVDYLELEKALLWAVTEDAIFDRQEFLDMCKDIYHKKHGTVPPRLYAKSEMTEVTNPEPETGQASESTPSKEEAVSKEDQLIHHFNSITHRELLEDHSSSGIASMKEIEMITNLMEEHGLTQPVTNVLVHYVLKKNGNKLSRNYLDTIAAHWSREKITTAKEAMDIAKREHHMYQKWQEKKKQKNEKRSAAKSNEVLPKWFKEQKQQEQAKQATPANEKQPDEGKDLEAFFKSFSQSKHEG